MQNQHEWLALKEGTINVEVTDEINRATLADARLDQVEVAPGDEVGVTVRLQPYGQPEQRKRLTFEIPTGLEEGEYQFTVADAQGYLRQYLNDRPQLLKTASVDDLHHTIQQILSVRRDAVYLTLRLNEEGLALGRTEMPQLPSSRKAILSSPTSTAAIPFTESVDQVAASDYVTQGQLSFRLHVRKDNQPERRQQDD